MIGRSVVGNDHGEPAPDISDSVQPLFFMYVESIRRLLPAGKDYGGWRRLTAIEREDIGRLASGHLTESDELRQQFLEAELKLSMTFLLVRHLDECRSYADEAIFMQSVRNQIAKTVPGQKSKQRELDQAVRDLVDEHVELEGVFDIFRAAGLQKADLSILDDRFLQTFKDQPHENLRLKLLAKLLADEIKLKQAKNATKAKTFSELLIATLQKYHIALAQTASLPTAIEV